MTAEKMAKRLEEFPQMLEQEFRKTIQGVAIAAVAYGKQKMTEEIYAIPEDLTRQGRTNQRKAQEAGRRFVPNKGDRQWVRTGHLRRSEKFDIRSPYEVAIVNTAEYAEPRHEAGKPGRRKINPLRVSHWRDDMVRDFHSTLADLAEVSVRKAMERLTR